MKYNKLKRYFLMLIVFSMLTSCFCFKAAAAEIDIYETEPNNTSATADMTEDLADNLGRISSASDIDWYAVVFDRGGITNFWLGDIPSGCDYQMQIYKGSTLVKTINNNSTGTSEFAQYNTLADTVYYIKISSNSGYNASSYYLFSMRRNNLGETRMFTYNCIDINTRPSADAIPHLWKTGYSGQEYLNNAATPVYNSLTLCNVMTIRNHANAGLIACDVSDSNRTLLYAKKPSSAGTNDREINALGSNALSEMRLLVFMGCHTGENDSRGYNLVDMAFQKGAKYVIGWIGEIDTRDANPWIVEFYRLCMTGKTIRQAIDGADEYIRDIGCHLTGIYDQYEKKTSTSLTIN